MACAFLKNILMILVSQNLAIWSHEMFEKNSWWNMDGVGELKEGCKWLFHSRRKFPTKKKKPTWFLMLLLSWTMMKKIKEELHLSYHKKWRFRTPVKLLTLKAIALAFCWMFCTCTNLSILQNFWCKTRPKFYIIWSRSSHWVEKLLNWIDFEMKTMKWLTSLKLIISNQKLMVYQIKKGVCSTTTSIDDDFDPCCTNFSSYPSDLMV